MSDFPGVAVIGCGLMGHKRRGAIVRARLVACADLEIERAQELAETEPGCRAYADWREAVSNQDVDIVIVATRHDTLAEIAAGAAAAGRHVLVEKPGARRSPELNDIAAHAAKTGVLVRVGFNHRYHRALQKARSLVDEGEIGALMFIRARYGHGGRIGYESEWRADPLISGGGELIDQGPHLIDLARWFLGDFSKIDGLAATFFWDMPVDDNCFMMLTTQDRKVAFLHVSCTEWKNLFSFEIYGRDGKIDISGLGGSYGTERITLYKMRPEMGPPETTTWEYPMADNSWQLEFEEFLEDVRLNRPPAAGLDAAVACLEVIETIYRKSVDDYNA